VTGKRDDLRALLDKFAANAGDPPEHGLDGVMARRRRRTRHRRGAVATAMALAVFGVVALPWLSGLQRPHDVSAASEGSSPERNTELPDVVKLFCAGGGIDVPVASIRPQHDGLHLDVDNRLGATTQVWVTADGWSSGRFDVSAGETSKVLAAPPGSLTVGCHAGDTDQQRRVDLVDVDHLYEAPTLDCPEEERAPLAGVFPVVKVTPSLPTAARDALTTDRIPDSVQMKAFTGYPEGDRVWDSPAADPVVQVVRSDETVALVHLAGTPPAEDRGQAAPEGSDATAREPTPVAPWTSAPLVEHCPAFLAPPSGDVESPRGQA